MMLSDLHYIAEEDGAWRCYAMPDGKTRQPTGCSHEALRDAQAHVEQMDGQKENTDG